MFTNVYAEHVNERARTGSRFSRCCRRAADCGKRFLVCFDFFSNFFQNLLFTIRKIIGFVLSGAFCTFAHEMENIPFKKILCESDRLQTFKNWPFKDGPCTAENLAKAGFFYAGRNGKDNHHVRCFVCFKKLSDLNESLNPFEEHRKENQNCQFVQIGMNQSEIKLGDFLQLLRVSVKGSLVSRMLRFRTAGCRLL